MYKYGRRCLHNINRGRGGKGQGEEGSGTMLLSYALLPINYRNKKEIHDLWIRKEDGHYFYHRQRKFSSIQQLLRFYKTSPITNNAVLVNPIAFKPKGYHTSQEVGNEQFFNIPFSERMSQSVLSIIIFRAYH